MCWESLFCRERDGKAFQPDAYDLTLVTRPFLQVRLVLPPTPQP